METSNLKKTLERMSGMPQEIRELLHSHLPFRLTDDNNKLNCINTSKQIETVSNKTFILDSPGMPFPIMEMGRKNREDISRDSFIDDQKINSGRVIKIIDERLKHLKGIYHSRLASRSEKRVVVLGAGPVGLRCAIGAALAGNKVTVIEQFKQDTRTRYLGLFEPEQQFLANLGAPLSMFVELSIKGVLKRLVTIADLQAFLAFIAYRLSIEIRWQTKAVVNKKELANGKLNYTLLNQKTGNTSHQDHKSFRASKHKQSKTTLNDYLEFDMIVDASGANSELRKSLVGENVTGFRELCQNGLDVDGNDFISYFSSLAPSGAEFINEQPHHMDYWKAFVEKIQTGHSDILDDICCFVGNIDKSVFRSDTIPDLDNNCPPDWIWKRFIKTISLEQEQERDNESDDIFRVHLEGPFPQKYHGQVLKAIQQEKNCLPTHVILAFLKASKMEDAIDTTGWESYCSIENSSAKSAHNTASLFNCKLTGIKTNLKQPTLWGKIAGSDSKEYFIAGDAAQTPWYRFGVGIMDGFYSGSIFDQLFFAAETDKHDLLLMWERYLRLRSVQILFSIYCHDQMLCDNKMMNQILEESGIILSNENN